MLRDIRSRIAYWIFPEIILEKEAFQTIKNKYEQRIADFEVYKDSLTTASLVRERLRGFDPSLILNDDQQIIAEIPEAEQESFLEKAKSIKNNPVFKQVCDFIVKHQLLFSTREAQTLEQINFGRATVNGIMLLEEEIDSLVALYEKRHERDEPIEPGEAV